MNSKERVLTAFSRAAPDRVPVNYLFNPGIDGRLKKHFGLPLEDNEGILAALGVDFRSVSARYTGPKLHPDFPDRGVVSDDLGIRRRWIQHESGGYWDYCDFPLKDASEQEVAEWPLPDPDNFDYSKVKMECARYKDFAVGIGGPSVGDFINKSGMLRGMEQTLIDFITDEPAGLLLAKRRADTQIETLRRTIEASKGGIDFLWMGEDLGTQIAPLISLELYRKHLKPLHKRYVDLAKSFKIPVMIHSCGSSSWAYEDFIEIGIDVVDTLQPEAANMAPEYLKKKFGGRLAFHGCISTAGPVSFGTPKKTADYCKKTLEIMMPGGGYCFAPTHQLQDNSPTENVLAMYETARTCGKY